MKKPKVVKPKWTGIFFYDGPEIKTQCVLTSDLPSLSGALTFWREWESDEERVKLMKSRIATKLAETRKTPVNIE
jgi:hypothetical protein